MNNELYKITKFYFSLTHNKYCKVDTFFDTSKNLYQKSNYFAIFVIVADDSLYN